MSGLWTIYRRELAGLFFAPLAWILLCLSLLYNAFFFLLYLKSSGGRVDAALEQTLGGAWPFWILALFLPPLITMRMISEESRSGMLEFVLTAPVSDAAVVLGKACAATTFLSLLWACVPVYGLALHVLGAPPDWGQVATGYLGAVLVSALFSAMGLTASALTGTPILAAFLAMLANVAATILPLASGAIRDIAPTTVDWLTERINVIGTFQSSFLTGALDSAHLAFFVIWTAIFLFAATRLIEARRWWG
ncbi:MAG: ABC transporter permease [Planctomycetota bacterium]